MWNRFFCVQLLELKPIPRPPLGVSYHPTVSKPCIFYLDALNVVKPDGDSQSSMCSLVLSDETVCKNVVGALFPSSVL